MVIATDAVLFEGTGSAPLPTNETAAVFVIEVFFFAMTLTLIVTTEVDPLSSALNWQLTVPDEPTLGVEQVADPAVMLWNVTVLGSTSTRSIEAIDGPWLPTVMVYVTMPPRFTVIGVADMLTRASLTG